MKTRLWFEGSLYFIISFSRCIVTESRSANIGAYMREVFNTEMNVNNFNLQSELHPFSLYCISVVLRARWQVDIRTTPIDYLFLSGRKTSHNMSWGWFVLFLYIYMWSFPFSSLSALDSKSSSMWPHSTSRWCSLSSPPRKQAPRGLLNFSSGRLWHRYGLWFCSSAQLHPLLPLVLGVCWQEVGSKGASWLAPGY